MGAFNDSGFFWVPIVISYYKTTKPTTLDSLELLDNAFFVDNLLIQTLKQYATFFGCSEK